MNYFLLFNKKFQETLNLLLNIFIFIVFENVKIISWFGGILIFIVESNDD